jgi:hypothetical protein
MINEGRFVKEEEFIIFKEEGFIKGRFGILEEDIFSRFSRA